MAHGGIQEYIKYQEYAEKLNSRLYNKEEIQPARNVAKDVIDEPFYPSDLTLSIFAATVYNAKVKENLCEGLQPLKNRKNVTEQVVKNIEEIQKVKEWRLLAWGENPDDGYFGAAFWNKNHNQLVISHRGTDPKELKTFITDIEGIIRLQYTSQIHSACAFSALVLNDLDLSKIQVSITGHSLGAWLAQISTFTTEYFILEGNIFTIRKGKLKNSRSQVHAVVFDSPGCYEMLCQIAKHYFDKYEQEAYTLISALDITIYFNIPNLVNSLNSHHGISRILQIREISEDVTSENTAWNDLASHKSMNFIRMLSSPDNVNFWTVLNWPSFVFPKAGKNKKSGKPLALSKSINKVIKLLFSSLEVFMSSENELLDYYKRIQGTGDSEEGRSVGGITINHKIVQVDQKSRNISIFSEEQINFLKYWKRVKDEKVAPDKFKNIQEILEKNDLQHFNDFLPFFEFFIDESNKKKIRAHSKQDLEKIIGRVKNLLTVDPQAFDHMKKDADELLTTYETLYKSSSKSYLQILPSLDVDFRDYYKLLESKEKVLAFITKNDTKYEVFRIRNILKSQDENEQCYLGLTELEQIVQHVDVNQIFEDPNCRVDKILILDCQVNVENTFQKYLENFLKTAKNSEQNDKKLIIVVHDSYDWLKDILNRHEIRTDEVEFSFLDFTEETQKKLFTKKIVTLWNKEIAISKFLNVIESNESAQEQVEFLSHSDFLFPLLTAKYVDLELSSEKVINHDNLKVLTIDLQKNITLDSLWELLGTNPKDLVKVFGKPVLFILTGISEIVFKKHFEKISSNIKFANDDSSNFVKLCRQNIYKKLYWIHFVENNFNSIELRKIFDPDFYIERRMLKQRIINKTIFSQFLKEVNTVQSFIISGITYEHFFQLLNIDTEKIKIEYEKSETLEIVKISTNVLVFTDSIEEALDLFNNVTEKNTHLLIYKKCCQKFIWKSSNGPLNTIRNIVSFDKPVMLTELDLAEIPDKVIIIAGESGTGKSTILLRYAKTLTSSWVIWVKLLDYRKKFDNIKSEENLENIVEFLLNCNKNSLNPFTKSLLKFNLTHETRTPVVIFFDGYDEIVKEEIQSKMLRIFKFLQKETNASIWITTKIWAKDILEDELFVFSIKIREIEKDQQKTFIKNFWLAGSLINPNLKKVAIDGKAEEFFRESEQNLIIQRHLSARDCLTLENAWDKLVNNRYEREVLDNLMEHLNTLYRLTKNGQRESLELNIVYAIFHLHFEEKAHKDIGEFLNILNLAWYLDFYSQRYLKNRYLESTAISSCPEELAKTNWVQILIEILLVAYEDKAENQPQIQDIFTIPLQLRMIGEIIHRQQNDSEISTQTFMNLLTDHYNLYKEFITIKFHIYNKEKLKKEGDSKSTQRTLSERHQYLAIQLLFPDQYQDILDDEVLDLNDESWREDIIKMNQIGIIDLNNSGTFTFNHISFAEYFTAEKMFNFLKKTKLSDFALENLITTEILLREENIMIRKFLDGMLANAPKITLKFFEKVWKKSPGAHVNDLGETALHVCASENLINLAAALLNSFKDESRLQEFMGANNMYSETALHYTAANNQTELATLLLSRSLQENLIKFDVSQVSHLFSEELPLAATVNFSTSSKDVKIFLTENSKVIDITPCATEDIPELLNLVLKFNKIEDMSNSSLQVLSNFAIKNESPELALSILNLHPDSLRFNESISRLLHQASKKGLRSTVLELIRMKADINTIECKCQSTPLYLAAKGGHWELVSELIDLGADVNISSSEDQETVLHQAAFSGKIDIILKLLEKGADINAIEKGRNYTPITVAAANSHWDAVSQFLEFVLYIKYGKVVFTLWKFN